MANNDNQEELITASIWNHYGIRLGFIWNKDGFQLGLKWKKLWGDLGVFTCYTNFRCWQYLSGRVRINLMGSNILVIFFPNSATF